MKTLANTLLILIFGLFSCSTSDKSVKNHRKKSHDSLQQILPDTARLTTDSIERFIADNYPVTDDMLDDKTSNNSSFLKQNGDLHSFDKAWFTNEALNQSLVFEMYTDKHRLVVFHFSNNDIPEALIDRMELHVAGGVLASLEQKKKHFKGLINSAPKIDSKYFTSGKGIKLGDSKEKVLRIYGIPDEITNADKLEIYEWIFVGDILYDGKTDLKGKPLVKDSYGHQATMIFRTNKLIAMILFNDIP